MRESITVQEANEIKKLLGENGGKNGCIYRLQENKKYKG